MKTAAPQLTPFVRSDAVGSILAETLGHPDRELSLAELGRRTGVSAPVVHREVERLVTSGVLKDRVEGRNRLVSAEQDHPLFRPMRQIIEATYGPVPVLRELFKGAPGVRRVFIYGSWAARRVGLEGGYPNDLDVLVVGETPRRMLTDMADSAGQTLGLPVNVTRLQEDEWDGTQPSPFVEAIKARPMVDVMTGDVRA